MINFNVFITDNFGYWEAEANGRVGKRHDGGEDWKPWELVKVWYLAEQELDASKYYHEWVIRRVALHMVTMFVETIRPLHRSAHMAKDKSNHSF